MLMHLVRPAMLCLTAATIFGCAKVSSSGSEGDTSEQGAAPAGDRASEGEPERRHSPKDVENTPTVIDASYGASPSALALAAERYAASRKPLVRLFVGGNEVDDAPSFGLKKAKDGDKGKRKDEGKSDE